jgi:hypothetical protein
MSTDLTLSVAQLELLEELLQREQKQILIEIRHTDAAAYRENLRQRLATVDCLLDQMECASPFHTTPHA